MWGPPGQHPQGSRTPCPGSGAECWGLPPLRLSVHPGVGLGLPPEEQGPQDRVGPPPQLSLHAMVQLPAAVCVHCSPDVPALGTKCVRPAERWGEPGHHPPVMSKSAESPQLDTGEGAGPVLSISRTPNPCGADSSTGAKHSGILRAPCSCPTVVSSSRGGAYQQHPLPGNG